VLEEFEEESNDAVGDVRCTVVFLNDRVVEEVSVGRFLEECL